MLNYESIFNSFLFIFPIILFLEKTKKIFNSFLSKFLIFKKYALVPTPDRPLRFTFCRACFFFAPSLSTIPCGARPPRQHSLSLSLSLCNLYHIWLYLSLYNIWPGRRAVPWRLRLGLAWPVYGLAGERFLAPAPWPGVACDPVYGLPACRRSCIWRTPWLGVAYGLSAGMLHGVCPCMI